MRALASFCLALCLALPASADEADTLLVKIQSDLRDITRDIRDLGRSSADKGDVENVASAIYDMVDDLLRLIRVMGDNHQAERTIEGYPSSMDELIDSLEVLAQMKAMTGEFQPGQELCAELLENIPGEMSAVLIEEGTSVRTLDQIGDAYARDAQSLMRDAERHLDDLDDMGRGVKGYRPDHRDFNAHAAALSDAADTTYEAEEEAYNAMAETCEKVIEYRRQPYYQDAETLLKDRENAISEFLNTGRAWLDKNRDIGGRICESHRLLRQAYCDFDMEPENISRRDAYDTAVEDSARTFRAEVSEALRDYERNFQQTGELYAPLSRDVRDLLREINARRDYLSELESGAPLKGINNPATRLWRDYGVQQHGLLQQDPDCHLTERAIPGFDAKLRVDCIDVADCEVIEFKPDSSSGIRSGARVDDYVRALNAWLETEWDEFKDEPVASRRASSASAFNDTFVRQAIAYECLVDGEGRFDGHVEPYQP